MKLSSQKLFTLRLDPSHSVMASDRGVTSTGTSFSGRPSTHETWAMVIAVVALFISGFVLRSTGAGPGLGMVTIAICAAVALVAAYSPVAAVILLMIASFFRVAINVPMLPAEPFVLTFASMIGAAVLGVYSRRYRPPRVGRVELTMTAFLAWNVASMVIPHQLPAYDPIHGVYIVVWRFILTGVVVPFALFIVGRTFFITDASIMAVLWSTVGFSLFSALVSIGQQSGVDALVWPDFRSDPDSTWVERAVGVFNQPVVNGLVLTLGFVVCLYVGAKLAASIWQRILLYVTAMLCIVGVYLTLTRMAWLAFAVTLVLGALIARGFRSGFILPLAITPILVAVNWASFSSNNRKEGGVASVSEVDDRLNNAATAIWAMQERPVAGWGIARFTQVNTFYHQQWSQEIPWNRGYGYSSHENELGIATELGLIGLAMWLLVLVLLTRLITTAVRSSLYSRSELVSAQRRLAAHDLAILAFLGFVVWFLAGFTNDLRHFDFVNALVMLLVGIAVGKSDRERQAARPSISAGS